MKRKDWKIKKLEKNIYDSAIVNYIKNSKNSKILIDRNMSFLRKLFLRKNLVLFKKNLIIHFFIYRKIINSFLKSKYFIFNNLYNLKNYNHLIIFPDFFHKKYLLNNHIFFKKIMKENNLNFFLKNIEKSNNIVVFNQKNNSNILEKIKDNFDEENSKKHIFSLKKKDYFEKLNFHSDIFNFFFVYNITLFSNVEIYKILILLYVKNLNN